MVCEQINKHVTFNQGGKKTYIIQFWSWKSSKNCIQSIFLKDKALKPWLSDRGQICCCLLTLLLYLFIFKHYSTGREGRRGWPSQITDILQGMSASLLFLLIVAITFLFLLSCYSLQNGMHGWWVHFQYNSDSKEDFRKQDLSVNCKTNLYTTNTKATD